MAGGRDGTSAWMPVLRQDLAHAWRLLGRAPRFTLTAVLTLGLATGIATAMFGVVDAVLLRTLPVADAGRVVALVPRIEGEARGGSPGLLTVFRDRARTLAGVTAAESRQLTLVDQGPAERVGGFAVDGRFFQVVGARPLVGRTLVPADEEPGAPRVVVIGEALWRRAFAGDAGVVGRIVRLDGVPHVVVGVMPDALRRAIDASRDVWVPLALPASQRDNFTPYLTLVGRLAPGARLVDAERELATVARDAGPRAADEGRWPTFEVSPLHRWTGASYRTPLLVLLGAVVMVLLIGCANVATLVLVRGVGRARELAVRAALGAGRGRLLRQLATEHVLLGLLAAAVAIPVAIAATRLVVRHAAADVPRLGDVAVDARALAVAIVLGVVTSLLAGLGLALQQRRLDVAAGLRGTRGATDARGERWRRALVGGEVALAVVLVAAAGLMLRTAVALARVQPGFDTAGVLTARLALPKRDYPQLERAVQTFERVASEAAREPGVAAAGLVSRVPLGGSQTGIDVTLAGGDAAKAATALRLTSGGYFRAMGIPLLAGRDLAARDDRRAAPVVVVNAALARRLGLDPRRAVGQRVRSDNGAFADASGAPREMTIVGVVGDVLDGGPRAVAEPELYAPMGQVGDEPWDYWIGREMLLVVRAERSPATLAPALRRVVQRIDARVPLYDVRTTGERVAAALAVERFSTRLLVALGLAALALAAIGIHGVVAYAASARAREMGIRLALGATGEAIVGLVVGQGMRPVWIGLAAGLAVVAVAGRALEGLLFGVRPFDPASIAVAVGLLALAGLVACLGPARRLARVDPAITLRGD